MKRRKATGIDNLQIDIIKELNNANLELIREVGNQWWSDEYIPDEDLKAKIALIS